MTAPPADAATAEPAAPTRAVLIVCGDLLTGGPLVQAVRQAGLTPIRALSTAKADPGNAAGVVLDLSLPGALAWLSERPADGPPTLSFGPHVLAELLKAARAEGRGPVLTRSQLANGLPAWLGTL